MQLDVPPDMAAVLNSLVASGAYENPQAALVAAIQALKADQLRESQEQLHTLIQEGIQAADRGELIDGEEVFEEILRDLESEAQPT